MLDYRLVTAVLMLACAYYYAGIFNDGNLHKVKRENRNLQLIQRSWNNLIAANERNVHHILVGINGNVDLIVRALPLLNSLDLPEAERKDMPVLSSLGDLASTFTNFFARGSAAERNFDNRKTFDVLVAATEKLEHREWSVGGNAALIAQSVASRYSDVKVSLIGPIGPKLTSLLHERVVVPEVTRRDADEVHMILEYSVGEKFRGHTTPVATRFITSYDEANSQADSIELFFKTASEAQADLLVFSGLHLLDSLSKGAWLPRTEAVLRELEGRGHALPPLHLELASMANEEFVGFLVDKIIPRVTSLGLNEQELSFLSAVGGGPHPDLFSRLEGPPRPHLVGDMLAWLLETVGSKVSPRVLTRVHFHCLTYHVVATLASDWSASEASVAAGVSIAGQQACDEPTFSARKFELRLPKELRLFSDSKAWSFDPAAPVHTEGRGQFSFSFSPVVVCKKPVKTVGLGDAISAAGLMHSVHGRS